MAIKIKITGGTIDGLEYDSPAKAPKEHKTLIPELLRRARIIDDYNIEEVMSKDSKFITESDRNIILEKCRECEEKKIVITHGTMTMPLTAKFLGEQKIDKTIVLTGADIPANKANSDALFNLGFAIGMVQLLPVGVYVAMNGNVFEWDNVKKNPKTRFFEKER